MKDLEILSTGPGWIAIDKPAGLSVHNDPESGDVVTLLAARLAQDSKLSSRSSWEASFGVGPVHRLDRETSGVLLLATSKASATLMQRIFEARETSKTYRALLRKPIALDSANWTWPLTDRAEGRRDPAGPPSARKSCETRVRVISRTAHLSEVEIELVTGRQHQIRRHAVLAGHEVIGDSRYGDPRYVKAIAARIGQTPRLMLHAQRLSLDLGAGGKIDVASEVPKAFGELLRG